MWQAFIFENLHFIVNILAGLTFILVSWLHFGAWKDTQKAVVKWKVLGFFLIGMSFLFRSLDLTSIVINNLSRSQEIFKNADYILRLLGYLMLLIGLFFDPLQPKPKLNAFALITGTVYVIYLYPILSVLVFLFYIKRASIGLERHLYPVSFSFLLLTIYELLYLFERINVGDNLFLFKIVSPFSIVWQVKLIVLVFVIISLGSWVIKYLLKQFDVQVFIYQMVLIVFIYFTITAGFTGIFMKDIKNMILSEMKSEGKIINYALNDKKEKLVSDARYVVNSDTKTIDADSMIKFDLNGVITYQMEDESRKGSSITSDNLVREVLEGKTISDLYVKDNVLLPTIYVRAGVPTLDIDGKINGGVIVSNILDSAWIRGYEKDTGLTFSLYAKDIQVAGRDIGIQENNTLVIDSVLTKGSEYIGDSNYINTNNLSYFSPLKDIYNNNIGMLYVGRPSIDILKLMVNSLEIIFGSSLLLLVLSIIPARYISRSIAKQIK